MYTVSHNNWLISADNAKSLHYQYLIDFLSKAFTKLNFVLIERGRFLGFFFIILLSRSELQQLTTLTAFEKATVLWTCPKNHEGSNLLCIIGISRKSCSFVNSIRHFRIWFCLFTKESAIKINKKANIPVCTQLAWCTQLVSKKRQENLRSSAQLSILLGYVKTNMHDSFWVKHPHTKWCFLL